MVGQLGFGFLVIVFGNVLLIDQTQMHYVFLDSSKSGSYLFAIFMHDSKKFS